MPVHEDSKARDEAQNRNPGCDEEESEDRVIEVIRVMELTKQERECSCAESSEDKAHQTGAQKSQRRRNVVGRVSVNAPDTHPGTNVALGAKKAGQLSLSRL